MGSTTAAAGTARLRCARAASACGSASVVVLGPKLYFMDPPPPRQKKKSTQLPSHDPQVEDAEVVAKAPRPPTDTPADDLALAARQVQPEEAAGSSTTSPVAAASAAGDSQAPEQEKPGEDADKKRQPRVVAT